MAAGVESVREEIEALRYRVASLEEAHARQQQLSAMLFRQVEAWQQLDESKAATIADMRAELDSARTTIARMEEQIAELRAQVAEVPGWRERVQLAELERDMWQRYARTLEGLLTRAGIELPSPPPLAMRHVGEGG